MRKHFPILSTLLLLIIFFIPLKPKLDLKIPKSYSPGSLIELDASGSRGRLSWVIIPETEYKLIDHGKRVLFSSPQSINYIIILSGAKGGRIISKIYYLNPVSNIQNSNSNNQISFPSLPSPINPATLLALSESFNNIATLAENNTFQTLDEFFNASIFSNNAAIPEQEKEAWKEFFKNLQDYIQKLNLKTVREHIPVWRKISQVLKNRNTPEPCPNNTCPK